MRNTFGKSIYELSQIDDKLILLTGDIGNRLFDELKFNSPEKMINCGIAEQGMTSFAAGLAHAGLKPYLYTITPFLTYRNYEQIRVDLCYNDCPVVLVGTGSGLSYASLGPTHQSLEDIAILRALPNMTVFVPCDPEELRAGLRASLDFSSPMYIRIGKKGEPNLSSVDGRKFRLGKAVTLRKGKDTCIIGCGPILRNALDAADKLETKDIDCAVENFHTVKPFDEHRMIELAKNFDHIYVLEEHGKIGGLFGAVAETCVKHALSTRITPIGVGDEFLHKIGDQQFALSHFGMDADSIFLKIASQ